MFNHNHQNLVKMNTVSVKAIDIKNIINLCLSRNEATIVILNDKNVIGIKSLENIRNNISNINNNGNSSLLFTITNSS